MYRYYCNTTLAGEYEVGTRVPQDFVKSFYWFSKAAAQTNELGEIGVCNAYLTGHGTPINKTIGDALTIKMANEGDAKMQYSAGLMFLTRALHDHENFQTDPTMKAYYSSPTLQYQTNLVNAYKWLSLATIADARAKDDRDEAASYMTALSLKAAQIQTKSFVPKPRTGLQFYPDGKIIWPPIMHDKSQDTRGQNK